MKRISDMKFWKWENFEKSQLFRHRYQSAGTEILFRACSSNSSLLCSYEVSDI